MAAMMNGNTATQDGLSVPIAEKLQFFRNSDAERDQLVQRVLQNYEQLKHEYADKCTDYENEIASRRMWQQKHMQLDRQISESRQASQETNPFVLALIDGDGAIFQDALYQSGATGGADAAHRLHTAIRSHIAERYPDVSTSHWSIMV
ncbi:hypothetical protein M8818_003151 [Zalaria obscura]|uniref:Uncharacterized protein n=1 Tax=Zalaria obscura TaxID=2024903 RepID=A0ACC3SG26_9PEZI